MSSPGGGRAHPSAVLPWVIAALGAGAAVATAVLVAVNHASVHNLDDANIDEVVLPLGFSTVGVLVATRRRGNPVGWLFLFMALDLGVSGVFIQYSRLAQLTLPGSLPGAAWGQWEYSWVEALVYPAGAASLTMLLMPHGRLVSRRWRPAVWASIVLTLLLAVITAVTPGSVSGTASNLPAVDNPAGVQRFAALHLDAVGLAIGMTGLALSVVAASAPVVRLVRSRGEERQQLKWIALAVILSAAASAGLITAGVVITPIQATADVLSTLAIALGFGVALPLATAIAIFRHRLYDVDLVIRRTLVYGALAAVITAIYVSITVGLGALAGQRGSPNVALSVVATAIVAVAFQPLRERLDRAANRLVYGRRATPYDTLSTFSQRVAESYALDEVLPQMARVLAEGTAAQRAGVWLNRDGALRRAASWPETAVDGEMIATANGTLPAVPGADRAVAVRHDGRLLGMLTVTKRPGETMNATEDRLVDDLAHQAGLVLRNVGLNAELQRGLDELRASRRRLVSAQDMERRRLERDLHDGAQQQLVALKVKLGLARTLAHRCPAAVAATLDELRSDADEAIATLRDLAHGLYPPLLAERGLGAALEAQARRSPLSVEVHAGGVRRYAEQVESCVYFCCLEAIQNAHKHARAQRLSIRLEQREGALRFEVTDDGVGFDTAASRRGAGFENMRDRLEALGGRLEIRSAVASGACIAGELPADPQSAL